MPRPLRSSCDRCHSQKLKCPKEPGSATCSRCRRAGSNCVFSPAGPAWRRSSSHVADNNNANANANANALLQQNSQRDGGLDLQFTWPPLFDAGDLPMTHLDCVFPPLPDPTRDTTSQDPRSTCVQQLSAIAVEIHDVSVELSPVASLHLAKGSDPEELYSQHVIHVSHSRCIEQLFTLAQRLIDLYPDLIRLLSGESNPCRITDCQDPDCLHNSDLPDGFADVFSEPTPARSRVDMFLFHILAACHDKVSDVLDYIVDATKFCAKVTTASPDLIQPQLHIPKLRVGSFVASATSASSMQATLFAHITLVLMENVKSLRKTLEDASKSINPPNRETRIILLQCELLEERSQRQAGQFGRIRDGLTKYSSITRIADSIN
ncbi:hypothetical protein GGR51DRAFT_562324 [Nemania sp. FL0031]|nr:hypothetical protein GGR51DRAFT_562324 [Nemania sp. FL0031]